MQARIDEKRVAFLLLGLGFLLNPNKCQFEPAQMFIHLGLTPDTWEMIVLLSMDKVQAIKYKANRVDLSTMSIDVMKLLGLTNSASMALPLVKLHSHSL